MSTWILLSFSLLTRWWKDILSQSVTLSNGGQWSWSDRTDRHWPYRMYTLYSIPTSLNKFVQWLLNYDHHLDSPSSYCVTLVETAGLPTVTLSQLVAPSWSTITLEMFIIRTRFVSILNFYATKRGYRDRLVFWLCSSVWDNIVRPLFRNIFATYCAGSSI